MKALPILGVLLLLPGWATAPNAAQVSVTANVTKTMVADQDRWGGCIATLDVKLAAKGLNCRGTWVSFSCSGDFTTKDIAYRMFDTAQMAYALGHPVVVVVDDTKKHNGYCYANSIQVKKK